MALVQGWATDFGLPATPSIRCSNIVCCKSCYLLQQDSLLAVLESSACLVGEEGPGVQAHPAANALDSGGADLLGAVPGAKIRCNATASVKSSRIRRCLNMRDALLYATS